VVREEHNIYTRAENGVNKKRLKGDGVDKKERRNVTRGLGKSKVSNVLRENRRREQEEEKWVLREE